MCRETKIFWLPLFMWAQCRFPVGLENDFHSENPKTKIMKLESVLHWSLRKLFDFKFLVTDLFGNILPIFFHHGSSSHCFPPCFYLSRCDPIRVQASWCSLVLLLCTLWEPCALFSSIYYFLLIKKKKEFKCLKSKSTETNLIKDFPFFRNLNV